MGTPIRVWVPSQGVPFVLDTSEFAGVDHFVYETKIDARGDAVVDAEVACPTEAITLPSSSIGASGVAAP